MGDGPLTLAPDHMLCTLSHPFSMFICGPSKSGKTTLCKEIIRRRTDIIEGTIKHVVYVAGQDQPDFIEFQRTNPEVQFTSHWDDSFLRPDSLVIFDDLGEAFSKHMNAFLTGFITKSVHHARISCIVILHNLYTPGLRTASLSVEYLVLFNFPRDQSTISTLARQAFPQNSAFLKSAYEFATKSPHGYLLIDLSTRQNPRFRVRTSVFSDPEMCVLTPL